MNRQITLPQGGQIWQQLGFVALGVRVYNDGGNWVHIPDVQAYVAPYSTAAFTLGATQVAKADTTPPPGQANQPTGSAAVVTFLDTPLSEPETPTTPALSQVTGSIVGQAGNQVVPATAALGTFTVQVAQNDTTGSPLPAGTYDVALVDGRMVVYQALAAPIAGFVLIGQHPVTPTSAFAAYDLALPIGIGNPPATFTFQPSSTFQPRLLFTGAVSLDVEYVSLSGAIPAASIYLTVTTVLRRATY